MLGNRMRCEGKKGLLVWAFLFLVGGIGAQAAPVVSSFKINNGAVSTMNPAVTLPNACEGATGATHSYMASESPDFTGAAWKPYASVPLFILSNTTSGTKTVYFKVKDNANAESVVTSDTITLSDSSFPLVAWGGSQNGLYNVPSPNSDWVEVSPSSEHCLALKSDGSLVVWGSNADGKCVLPSPNSGFVAVSAGQSHNLALKADGSVVAWGKNYAGECNVPEPNSDFVAVAAGNEYSLGLKYDGSIVLWGTSYFGRLDVPVPNSGFVAISAGNTHYISLMADGSVITKGIYDYGANSVLPSPNTGFMTISAGRNHDTGLRTDGTIAAWGDNTGGQCNIPVPNNGFVAVSAGWYHSLGLKSDGSLVAWGSNAVGQCVIPPPNSGFVGIAAGVGCSMAFAPEGMGNLSVTLTPQEVVLSGANWRLTEEAEEVWHRSNESVRARSTKTVTFKEVYGWVKPPDQTIKIETNSYAYVTGDYDRTSWTLTTACDHTTVVASPSGNRFPHKTTVALTPQMETNYWFDHWTGDVPAGLERSVPLVVTMDADKTIGVALVEGPLPPAPLCEHFAINSGAPQTANPTVTLPNFWTGGINSPLASYQASESPDFAGAEWKPYASVPLFTLSSATSGTKTVYFKVKNTAGVESAAMSDTITLGGDGYTIIPWGGVAGAYNIKGLPELIT